MTETETLLPPSFHNRRRIVYFVAIFFENRSGLPLRFRTFSKHNQIPSDIKKKFARFYSLDV